MDDEEREHYTKLFTFTFGISLEVLHLYFDIKILDKDEFFLFLDRFKHVLFHALHPAESCCECRNGYIPLSKKRPTLYPAQFNLLFNIENSTLQSLHNKTVQHCLCKYSASRSVEVDSLDISLVYAIVKTCCPSIHGNPQRIKDVKDTRNFLAHKSNFRLTKDEYDTRLNTVEKATLDLAKVVSSTFLKMIKKRISDFKKDVPSSDTVKDIIKSSNDDVCKRLESFMKNLVTEESKSMSKDIIDHIKKYKDELSIDINELIFEVKTHIHVCEQLPSQKIIQESGETGYATSTPQTAQPESTQSKNEKKSCVEWKLKTPDTWNVSKIKNALENVSSLLKQWFEIEFVFIGSLVIRTIVPEHILSNYDDFKSAVRSFLAKIVEVCQLDTDTPTVVKVDLNIFTEIPPTESSTNVNTEHKKSTLTSPCHYCKEELVCDNCTTNGRIVKLPESTKSLSSESDYTTDRDSITILDSETYGIERTVLLHRQYKGLSPKPSTRRHLKESGSISPDFTRKRKIIEEDDDSSSGISSEKTKKPKIIEEDYSEYSSLSGMDATPVTAQRRYEVQQPGFIPTISKDKYDRKFYKVNSGRVLVLNNIEFNVPGIDLGDRKGSDLDASVICQRFQDIGFEYDLEGDMTKEETFTWFEKAKTEMIADPVDCFVLVLLSHGAEDGIYARDSIMQIADIIEIFNATNCPQLRFKPKVLIIQCCRGANLCLGVDVRVDPNQADNKDDDNKYIESLGIQKICLPNEADFLFAYAAVPGTGAFRNVESGSPFIRHLSKAMETMEDNEDFYSVLTTVNKTVGLTYQPKKNSLQLNNVVQMPCFVSYLTKVLCLKQSA